MKQQGATRAAFTTNLFRLPTFQPWAVHLILVVLIVALRAIMNRATRSGTRENVVQLVLEEVY